MNKIKAWNNEGYFEYLDKDDLFDYSTKVVVGASEQKTKEAPVKHERYCWSEVIEKAERESKQIIKVSKIIHSPKYDSYFDVDDIYSSSFAESYSSVAYGACSDYLNKGDFNYREYGSRFGSGVVSDDYDN